MTAQEVNEHIAKNIVPQLQELGMEAFVLVGYQQDDSGKTNRVMMFLPGANPAYTDGLKQMANLCDAWGKGML